MVNWSDGSQDYISLSAAHCAQTSILTSTEWQIYTSADLRARLLALASDVTAIMESLIFTCMYYLCSWRAGWPVLKEVPKGPTPLTLFIVLLQAALFRSGHLPCILTKPERLLCSWSLRWSRGSVPKMVALFMQIQSKSTKEPDVYTCSSQAWGRCSWATSTAAEGTSALTCSWQVRPLFCQWFSKIWNKKILDRE